jgi:hypothetical protein
MDKLVPEPRHKGVWEEDKNQRGRLDGRQPLNNVY